MLKVGIAGIGHMGKMHLFNLSKLRDVKLVGVALIKIRRIEY